MSPAVEPVWTPASRGTDFAGQLAALRSAPRQASAGVNERVAALHGLSEALLSGAGNLREGLPADGLAFLSAFLREDNLRSLIAREVPAPDALSQFVAIGPRKSLRLLPRGLVCHWVAGNVPLLAVFSWAVSAALGNANAIRLSSRQGDVMSPLLRSLATQSPVGRIISDETLVVTFDRNHTEAQHAMSLAADVRIAWGGRDAVDAIRGLPTRWDCEDVVFGPRMSMAVIDPAVIKPTAVTRLVTDIVIFDQLACSSPQVVFVKGVPGEAGFEAFMGLFQEAFARQSVAFRRHGLDFAETFRISLDRSRAILSGGTVLRDGGTQWTVAIMAAPADGIDCTNRFVQVVPYQSLDEIYPFVPENAQTCVVQLPPQDLAAFSEQAAWRGVCRFPNPGEGNHFENPWDGIGLVSRLTRFVVRSEAGR